MPAILQSNSKVPAGVSPPGSLLTVYDSGAIYGYTAPGKSATKLTTGIQQQATQPLFSDSTSGVAGNFLECISPCPTELVPATITNIAITTSGNTSTCTVTATNTFIAGQTVRFSGTTTVKALNSYAGVVLSTGLSGSSFECTLTGTTVPSQSSASETGTATVQYAGRFAALSVGPNQG